MEISAIGGFSFCGKQIKNNKLDILLVSVDRDAAPNMTNSQAKRGITVTLGVYGKTAIERKQKIRELLKNWINKKGQLIFNDDADLFFEARLTENIPVSELNGRMDGVTLYFEASREMYGLEEKTLTGSNISIMTHGNTEIDTIFKISGNCTVTLGGYSFTLKNVTTPVYVDSKRMVVYTIVDGEEVNKAIDYTCTSPYYFLKLDPDATLNITSTAAVELRYRDTYIV